MSKTAITLVFTDVVGSSAAKRAATLGADVNERDRAYLEGIQTKHLRLIRSAVAEHNGTEVMTIGDSFFLTFAEPLDALRCCAAIQLQLDAKPIHTLRGPLQLRIGIHVGTPQHFEDSWHGTDVDIASRAQSAASPEQIIVTDAARSKMGEPLGITLRPLGTFTLKGVGEMDLWDADYDGHGVRQAAIRSKVQRRQVRLATTLVALLLMVPLLITGIRAFWPQNRPSSAAKPAEVNSLIIANFENKTGEPIFDGVLAQALSIQLEQSPVLNIVTREHLRDSLKYLGKSPDIPLTLDIARDIAVREGVKACLTGSIAKLGEAYLIEVTGINASTGDEIASAEAQAADKDHVLAALSSVSSELRAKLGESLDSIQKLDTPLGQATTPSLEAFQDYSMAMSDMLQRHDTDARGLFEQALKIDPNFAMADLGLGIVLTQNGDRAGKEFLTKAHELDKNLSERERFSIEGTYTAFVTRDDAKAVPMLELAHQTYPHDLLYLLDLEAVQSGLGHFEDSLATCRRGLEISPADLYCNLGVISALIELDRYPEALSQIQHCREIGLNDTLLLIDWYAVCVLAGDKAGMAQAAAAVEGRPDESLMTAMIALGQEYRGQYAAADQTWRQSVIQASAVKSNDWRAWYLIDRLCGRAFAELNKVEAAEINTALAFHDGRSNRELAAFTAAVCGQPSLAESLIDSLVSENPGDTEISEFWEPQTRAAIALANHRPQDAIQALAGNEQFDLATGSEYLRGLAYLELKDGPNAVNAFSQTVRHPGAMLVNHNHCFPQAQLGLARAYVLAGDKLAAKKAYDDFFATWKDADPDLPQLLAARKEYAVLAAVEKP